MSRSKFIMENYIQNRDNKTIDQKIDAFKSIDIDVPKERLPSTNI